MCCISHYPSKDLCGFYCKQVLYRRSSPAHSHVIRGHKKGKGKKSEVLIYLGDEETAPSLREVRGMRKADVKKALAIVMRRQDELMIAWRDIYGE